MGSGYKFQPRGTAAVAGKLRSLQTQVAAARRQSSSADLHSPLTPAAYNVTVTNIRIELGTSQTIAVENVPVPDGFTGATVFMTVALDGVRDASTSGTNQLSIQAYADVQTPGVFTRTFQSANSQGSITQSFAAVIAGLSGELPVGADGWGSTGWVAGSGVGHLSTLIVFLR